MTLALILTITPLKIIVTSKISLSIQNIILDPILEHRVKSVPCFARPGITESVRAKKGVEGELLFQAAF